MNKKKKYKFFSMIEVLSTIILIMIVSGALLANFRSSFQKGKSFRSREGSKQVYRALILTQCETGMSAESIVDSWEEIVKKSPLTSNKGPEYDGWNNKYVVSTDNNDSFQVRSEELEKYTGLTEEDAYWED
ncbi:MAG: type II secretion system protein [Chlamydiia bacterium]|nr:type II secretion system protein [Chlamydiia bacterium]